MRNLPKPLDYIEELKVSETFEGMVGEIAEAGWQICNLFQFGHPTVWRANLYCQVRSGNASVTFTEFADGATKEQALFGAILNMKQARNDKTREPENAPVRRQLEESIWRLTEAFHANDRAHRQAALEKENEF